jgi:hypothetical protein
LLPFWPTAPAPASPAGKLKHIASGAEIGDDTPEFSTLLEPLAVLLVSPVVAAGAEKPRVILGGCAR